MSPWKLPLKRWYCLSDDVQCLPICNFAVYTSDFVFFDSVGWVMRRESSLKDRWCDSCRCFCSISLRHSSLDFCREHMTSDNFCLESRIVNVIDMFDSLPSCPRHSEEVAPVLVDVSSSLPPCFTPNCAQRTAKEYVKLCCLFNVWLWL